MSSIPTYAERVEKYRPIVQAAIDNHAGGKITGGPFWVYILHRVLATADECVTFFDKFHKGLQTDPSYELRWRDRQAKQNAELFRLCLRELDGMTSATFHAALDEGKAEMLARVVFEFMRDLVADRRGLGYDDERMIDLNVAVRQHMSVLVNADEVRARLARMSIADLATKY